MVQRVFFTCNHLWHFCNIDLKLNGFDIIQTKKAEKSSCFLQFTQCVFNLENYKDSLRRCWGYHYCLFLKILFFFMWCNLTAENKKNSSVHWHKGFVNYIFFLSATNQHFVFFFFHLWQRYSFYVLCILLLILLQWTMLSEISIHFGRMI